MTKSKSFFIADLHIGHNNILNYEKQRSIFNSTDEHNEYLTERWNSVVTQDHDRVYIAGDCCWREKDLEWLKTVRGKKYLISGNHDGFEVKHYAPYFRRIIGALDYKKEFLVTHIPVHPQELEFRWNYNIHGHTHSKRVLKLDSSGEIDKRYFCISCEHIGFTPIEWDELVEKIRNQ